MIHDTCIMVHDKHDKVFMKVYNFLPETEGHICFRIQIFSDFRKVAKDYVTATAGSGQSNVLTVLQPTR